MEMLGNISAGGEVLAGIISQAGPKGDTGETGYTPQKGIDYFTEQDKQELMEELPPHIDEKMETFNQNVESKTNEFNQNATQKTTEYNNNATSKTNNFNQNAADKTEQMINQVIEVEAMVKRLNIEGNSKQETREGYNLVDFSSKGNFENDIFTTSGTLNYGYTGFDITDIFKSNAGKTLYFSCESFDFSNSNKGCVQLVYTKDGTSNYNGLLSNTGVFKPLTIPTDTSNVAKAVLQVFYNNTNTSGTTYTTKLTKPMLAFEENLPYEQYGVSPSIDYPSKVKSVGDNINLFDKDNAEILHVWLNRTGTTISTISNNDTSIIVPVKPNETYTVSKKASGTTAKNRLVLGTTTKYPTYSTELNVVNGLAEGTTETKLSIKTGENDKYLIAYIYSKDTLTTEQEMLDSIKICKGASTGAYSPYKQGSIEIKQDNGNSSDGELELGTIEGTTGNTTDNPARMRSKNFIEVDNTLKYTITSSENSNVKIFIFEYDKNKTYISRTSESWLTMPYQYNPTSNTKYIKIVISYKDNTNIDITKNIELKIYDKSQTKVLYTQKPFRAIGDVKDRFVKQNGVWYEEHNIEEKTLLNSDFASYSSVAQGNLFRTNVFSGYVSNLAFYSNYFVGIKNADTRANGTFYYNTNVQAFDFITDEYTSLSDFQTWVGSIELKVYSVLSTPTLIECTPEQVEVLNDIYSAYGEGLTNITCTDEVEPVIEIIKETKETVQSNNDKAISALLERVSQLESVISSMQSTTAEGGA